MATYKQRNAHAQSVMTKEQAARIASTDDWESYAAAKQRIRDEELARMRARRRIEELIEERRLRKLLDW